MLLNMKKQDSTAMLFIDGTWLYYSLVKGRDHCPVQEKYGSPETVKWQDKFMIDWTKIPVIIERALFSQLSDRVRDRERDKNINREIDSDINVNVTKTFLFTSTMQNTKKKSPRLTSIDAWRKANFDVTHLDTIFPSEKCVDISLAVEMLYQSTLSNAYDIAVIVTGDKDFLPAIEKTRLKAKNVAICSMRNGCNSALWKLDEHGNGGAKDFDVIWLEDHLDQLIVPKFVDSSSSIELVNLITTFLKKEPNQSIASRELGRFLALENIKNAENTENKNALQWLKERYFGLKSFLEAHDKFFALSETFPDFMCTLRELHPNPDGPSC